MQSHGVACIAADCTTFDPVWKCEYLTSPEISRLQSSITTPTFTPVQQHVAKTIIAFIVAGALKAAHVHADIYMATVVPFNLSCTGRLHFTRYRTAPALLDLEKYLTCRRRYQWLCRQSCTSASRYLQVVSDPLHRLMVWEAVNGVHTSVLTRLVDQWSLNCHASSASGLSLLDQLCKPHCCFIECTKIASTCSFLVFISISWCLCAVYSLHRAQHTPKWQNTVPTHPAMQPLISIMLFRTHTVVKLQDIASWGARHQMSSQQPS